MIIHLISDDCLNNLDFVILTAKVLLEIDENLDENLTSLFTQVCKTDKMLTQEKGKYAKTTVSYTISHRETSQRLEANPQLNNDW